MKKVVFCFLIFSFLFFLKASAPLSGAETKDPAAAVKKFFRDLKKEKFSDAFEDIFKHSFVLDEDKDKPKNLARQVKVAVKGRGEITGHEQVRAKSIGASLYGLVYILKFEDKLPLRWSFLFYKHKDKWTLVDVVYDDRIMELLTEKQ